MKVTVKIHDVDEMGQIGMTTLVLSTGQELMLVDRGDGALEIMADVRHTFLYVLPSGSNSVRLIPRHDDICHEIKP